LGEIKMDFKEYQEKSKKTDLRVTTKENNLDYYVLGLTNEAGEVAGKIKKLHRDFGGELSEEYKKELAKEIGDVLWYVSAICDRIGYSIEEVAQMNLDKLASRMERNQLTGNGDNR
jgi:NTP pyrophosphatase (non-canonical NTP hydrolase)